MAARSLFAKSGGTPCVATSTVDREWAWDIFYKGIKVLPVVVARKPCSLLMTLTVQESL